MAAVLDISAEIPAAQVNDFLRACSRYKTEVGNSQAVAIRRGTIALVKSLRKLTARAKKQAPTAHVTRCENPKWITPKGKGQKSMRAWVVRRRVGSDRERANIHAADSRQEARAKFGKYTRWGLAKMSWGWFMHALFSRSMPSDGNPKAKVDSRMVEGYLHEYETGENPRIEVYLANKLDYIRDALPDSAFSTAMDAATKYINGQIDRGLAKAREELST